MGKIVTSEYFKEALKFVLTEYYEIYELKGFKRATLEDAVRIVDSIGGYEDMQDTGDKLLNSYIKLYEVFEHRKELTKLLIQVRRELGGSYVVETYERFTEHEQQQEVKETEVKDKNTGLCYNIEYNGKTKEQLAGYEINLELIRKAIKVNELTQKEYGDLVGISLKSVERKLNGETEFKANELIRTIKMFDFNIEDIIK